MKMHENKYIDILLNLVYAAIIGVGIYLFFKYAFKLTIPLIVAYFLSRIITRPVNFLHKRFRFPRKPATILCTLLAIGLFGSALYFIISRAISEGMLLANDLPRYIEQLPDKFASASLAFQQLLEKYNLTFFNPGDFSLEAILSSIKLPAINIGSLLSSVTWAASGVPVTLITTIFICMATYFLCGEQEKIFGFLKRTMGPSIYEMVIRIKTLLYNSVGKWIRAQCFLICITFVELTIGFTILGMPYAGLLGFLIALIDALPILGVGTVLIPWALISLLTGEFGRAAALCILYGIVLIVRNSIEPKIVGGQLGLDPFVTLICIYFGFRIAGFAGMFIIPMLAIIAINLHQWGYLRFGTSDTAKLPPPKE